MEFTVEVPSHLYANRTQGLCGVCAGYQQQLITSNGSVAENYDQVSFCVPHLNEITRLLVTRQTYISLAKMPYFTIVDSGIETLWELIHHSDNEIFCTMYDHL